LRIAARLSKRLNTQRPPFHAAPFPVGSQFVKPDIALVEPPRSRGLGSDDPGGLGGKEGPEGKIISNGFAKMIRHRSKIGQPVAYRPRQDVLIPAQIDIVTALLPALSREFKYRIRH
jgi:hypothetical protein